MWVHGQNVVTWTVVLSVTADDVGLGWWASRGGGCGDEALVVSAAPSWAGTWGPAQPNLPLLGALVSPNAGLL